MWGVILVKVFSGNSSSIPVLRSNIPVSAENMPKNQLVDTFSLHLAYADPFFGNRKPSIQPAKKIRKVATHTSHGDVHWPKLIYGGMIKKKGSTELLAFIQIDAKQHILKINDQIHGVRVLDITENEVKLNFKGETKSISK